MPAPRKPKKVFIQFAIALVVAVIFGAVAIFVGFMVIQGVSTNAQKVQKDAADRELAAKTEREKYQKMLDELKQAPKSFSIVKAVTDLSPGQPITKDMVTLAEVTERPAPGTLSMISHALGKVVKAPIISGEPIESGKLIDTGGFIGVEEGKRAITIQVDNIGGLAGALSPGAHVDVLTTIAQGDESITKTLLQNIPVVSVGGGGSSSASSKRGSTLAAPKETSGGNMAVTVIVTPKQAELLTLAGQLGGFQLTLRNFSDKQHSPLSGADMTALMTGLQPASLKKELPAAPQMPASGNGFHNVNYAPGENLPAPSSGMPGNPKFTMQIYRGTGSETVDFQH